MSVQSLPAESSVTTAQVWVRLAADLQDRAIQLMAQLAFNLVAAQSGWQPLKESTHAVSPHTPQDPT